MRWMVLFVLLICGCLSQQTVKEKYVCQDGSISDTAGACAGHSIECPKCVCPKTVNTQCVSSTLTTQAFTQQPILAQSTVADSVSDDACAKLGCPEGTKFVSSKTSAKYHACTCQFAAKLSAKSRVCYGSAQEAQAAGKQPCGICAGET